MTGKKRYQKLRYLHICIDDKDLNFLDDHRGKVARGQYLVQCLYASRGDHQRISENLTTISQLQKENHELKRQLLFSQSKKSPSREIDSALEQKRIELYDKINIQKEIDKQGYGLNYEHISVNHPDIFSSSKIAKDWIINHHRENQI